MCHKSSALLVYSEFYIIRLIGQRLVTHYKPCRQKLIMRIRIVQIPLQRLYIFCKTVQNPFNFFRKADLQKHYASDKSPTASSAA